MRFQSGVTDQYIYFVAVDSTDLKTRETGLSSFTVYRSRNGGAAAAYTTPTINETDSTNMPGVYELLLDEDMTIDSGDEEQEVMLHITAAGMAPVTLKFTLFRPKITAGETLTVASGQGRADVYAMQANVLTAAAIAADAITAAKVAADVTTEFQSGLATAAALATVDDFLDTEIAAIKAVTDLLPDAGALTSLATQASVNTIDDLLDTEVAAIKTVVDAIKLSTDNLPGDPADQSVLAGLISTVDDFVDTEVAAIKAVTDKLDTALELDGAVYRFTTNALEQSPTGAGGLDAAGVRAAVGLASANLDTQLTAIDDLIDTEVAAIKTVVDSNATKLDTIDDFLDTEIAAIKAKTDNLPTDPADASDIAAAFAVTNGKIDAVDDLLDTEVAAIKTVVDSNATKLDTIDDFLDTEVAAIKAKTDQLTFGTANRVDAQVYGVETGAITAGAIAADAIGASELAADAVTEIQSGLATAASITTLSDKVDTIDDFLDTEIAAIKAVTDVLGISIDGLTQTQFFRLIGAVLLGKASGLATTTAVYRALDDSKDRVTATVDVDGNRSAVTLVSS